MTMNRMILNMAFDRPQYVDAHGVRNAHLNQPVEVPSLRPQFAGLLGVTQGRPDLVVRFGRGPEMPRSLRRPLDAVLIGAVVANGHF